MTGRIRAVMGKEFRHILRDPRSLAIIFLMPVVMTFLYGYAINLDIKDIGLGVADLDRSTESRALTESFTASGQFVLTRRYPDGAAAEEGMQWRETVITLVIPAGYARTVEDPDRRGEPVQILVDGSDGNTASVALGYARSIIAERLLSGGVGDRALPVSLQPRFLYNPEQRSSHFVVPGLIAVILMMASAMLTSVTVVREKETGTLEQLLVSPIRSGELIVGKVVPYGLLALADGAFILFFGALVFGVPIRGDLTVLLGFTALYVMGALTVGLFISTLVRTQQVAMMAALLATVLPSFMLSNFIFPLRSMPEALQLVSHIVPARYYIPIVRGVLLKGVGGDVLWDQGTALAVFAVVLTAASILRFKPRLD
ncbi:MAG: ABC transporter permease [bacterium]